MGIFDVFVDGFIALVKAFGNASIAWAVGLSTIPLGIAGAWAAACGAKWKPLAFIVLPVAVVLLGVVIANAIEPAVCSSTHFLWYDRVTCV